MTASRIGTPVMTLIACVTAVAGYMRLGLMVESHQQPSFSPCALVLVPPADRPKFIGELIARYGG